MIELNKIIHKLDLSDIHIDRSLRSSLFDMNLRSNSLSFLRPGRFASIHPRLFKIVNHLTDSGADRKEVIVYPERVHRGYAYQYNSTFFYKKSTICNLIKKVIEKNLYIYVCGHPNHSFYKKCLIIEKPKSLRGTPKLSFSKEGIVLGVKNLIPVEFSFISLEEKEDLEKTALILKEILNH